MNLQAIAVALLAGLLLGGSGAYTLQKYKYEAQITKEHNIQLKALAESNAKVLGLERKYQDVTQSLNTVAAEATRKNSEVLAVSRALINSRNGLYVKSSSCKTASSNASTASNTASDTAPYTKLPDTITNNLLSEAARADEVGTYANVCYEYVKAIVKQREELFKNEQ